MREYTVTWTVEVDADSAATAAVEAFETFREQARALDASPPIFEVVGEGAFQVEGGQARSWPWGSEGDQS